MATRVHTTRTLPAKEVMGQIVFAKRDLLQPPVRELLAPRQQNAPVGRHIFLQLSRDLNNLQDDPLDLGRRLIDPPVKLAFLVIDHLGNGDHGEREKEDVKQGPDAETGALVFKASRLLCNWKEN